MIHPIILDCAERTSLMVNIGYSPTKGDLYCATFLFKKKGENLCGIQVWNSMLLKTVDDRLSMNHDPYGFTLQTEGDYPFQKCLDVALLYVLCSKIYQKTVGTLTKEEVRRAEADTIKTEHICYFWGPMEYLTAYRARGLEAPISETINVIRRTMGEYDPVRCIQWLEIACMLLGHEEGYKRISSAYGKFEELAPEFEGILIDMLETLD
jgi:hypothetical protein